MDADGNTIPGETGTLVDFNSDGTFSYDPGDTFNSLGEGESAYVAFDYTVYDGSGATDTATVTIEIKGANDNPTGEDPDAVTVYEAGLTNGSGDGTTTTMVNVEFTIDDPDGNDTPFISGSSTTATTSLTGDYGTLEKVDADTWKYTLDSKADHEAVQGHNGGITDTFEVYAIDGNGGSSEGLTVTVNVIDDINFLGTLPNGEDGADTVDDTSLNFGFGEVSDTFTHIQGADGAILDVVGIPDEFTLDDGRTITSEVYTDDNGNEAVKGTYLNDDGVAQPFYTLTLDAAGSYTFSLTATPSIVVKDVDFSSVSAGGPQEVLTVPLEDSGTVSFNGAFMKSLSDFDVLDLNDLGGSDGSDDVNPNNAGGIGIGNGNIEEAEVLCIDVSESGAQTAGIQLDLQGVGGGVGPRPDVLYAAVKDTNNNGVLDAGDELVDEGTFSFDPEKTINVKGGALVDIRIEDEFDFICVAIDPEDIDSNDKVRINRIATLELSQAEDIDLMFAINSKDGDGDQAPSDDGSGDPGAEIFTVTIDSDGDSLVAPDLVFV